MTIVLRWVLITAALLASHAARASFEVDENTAFVLRLRRLMPEVLRDAAKRNVNLPWLARLCAELARELGPAAPRDFQSVHVELRAGRPKITRTIKALSLTDLRYSFERVLRAHGDHVKSARPRVLAHVESLVHDWIVGDPRLLADYDRANMREDLVDLIRFALWSRDVVDHSPSSKFDETDALVFLNRTIFKDRFGLLRSELGVSRRRNVEVGRVLSLLRDQVARAVEFEEKREETEGDHLTLAEVPPEFALIKGYFAEDCSSHECAGYPLSPGDRVFLALDRNEEPRGGVVVSRVEFDGRPALYLNTLSGSRLDSPELVAMTLAGLRALLAPGEALVLPTRAVLERNFNFGEIKRSLRTWTALHPARPITFPDAAARRTIERRTFQDYDAVERHVEAHELPAHADLGFETSVTLENGSPWQHEDAEPFDDPELVGAMVDLVESDRLDMARDFWTQAGRAPGEASRLIDVLTNATGAARATWDARARDLLVGLGAPPERVDGWLADPERFTLARLVAADQRTSPTWVRHLSRRRLQTGHPAFRRWLSSLDERAREDLLHATLAALEDHLVTDGKSKTWVSSDLLVRLIDLAGLNARALALRKDYGWPTLVRAAEHLAGIGRDERLSVASESGAHMVALALASAHSAGAFRATFAELAAPEIDRAALKRGFGATLAHLASLGPGPEDLAYYGETLGAPALVEKLLAWSKAPLARHAGEFLGAIEAWGAMPPDHLSLVEAAVEARINEFRNTLPLAEDFGRLRRLAYEPGSVPEARLVAYALHLVHRFDDLFALERTPADDVLHARARDQIDLLANVYLATPPAHRGPPTHPLDVLVRRHLAMKAAGDVDHFFAAIYDHPLPAAGRRPRYGQLAPEQIDRFLALGPSIEQFRTLLGITGEAQGHARRLAPHVHDVRTLEKAVAPMKGPDAPELGPLRREFAALVGAVAARPGERNFLTEEILDRLMARAGLGGLRHEIPELPGPLLDRAECEDPLVKTRE